MKLPCILAMAVACGSSLSLPARGEDVVISEIMYNTPSANAAEEWIELHNRESVPVNVAGWRLSDGVSFTLPNVTIPANGYLVVAADLEVFSSLYPAVTNVVGGWIGSLSNNGEGVELEDESGAEIDRVRYATDGDWGVRRRLPDPATGTPGWDWTAEHDGLGKSLELINPILSNDFGQNWAPSNPVGGTPGQPNSVAASNIAPLIADATHAPIVPNSANTVTVSARILDEQTAGLVVRLFYRTLSNPFIQSDMFDDGAHNDGGAGDGVFAAEIPAMANETVVEFYILAADAANNTRTYPAPAIDQLGSPSQVLNLLYQVDDSTYTGTQPLYRIIMTEAHRLELQNINRQSDAEVNCTFVTIDGVETQVRHNCGIRIRGAGSRGVNPPNYRVNIPNDKPWKGTDAINLNTQFTHAQVVGSAVAQRAGLAAADARLVQVRVNARNLAGAGSPQFGSYAAVEPINADWAENHFPTDPDGNVYRASSGPHLADLSHRGTDPISYLNAGYSKTSNGAENDWSDLINLTFVLNNTPPASYTTTIPQVLNVREWMKYFAVITLMGYGETSLGTGEGDDYAMYRGLLDQRFLLIPHDFDTIFGQGGGGAITQPIFQAADFGDQPAVATFLTWPDFVPIYYDELNTLADTTFSAGELFPLFDRLLTGVVPNATLTAMKTFATNRAAFVKSQIRLNISVTTNTLQFVNGYFLTASNRINLTGFANVIRTRTVSVSGTPVAWNPMTGAWGVTNLALLPGINRVLIQSLDGNGLEFERAYINIHYDDGSIGTIPTTVTNALTLTAAGGPYEITTAITVSPSGTLVIEPGTTLFFEQGTSLSISGRLVAQGTDTRRIRLTRVPGSGASWGGIRFNNSNQDNRLTYADMEFAGTADPITLVNSTLLIDNVVWTGTTRTIIDLSNSSLICRNSIFPTIVDNETIHGNIMPPNGYVIIEGNRFGGTTGYSDIIDFTGGQRPGPILQVLNNIFNGGSDDALDLDGTDAHIEGNLFQHIHQDAPRDSAAHAIATDNASEITVVRNVFFDNDHAVLLKNGAFLTAENNTFVASTIAAISFDETNRNVNPGRGALIDGCIFWNNAALFRHLYVNDPVELDTELTVLRSLTQGTNHPGAGNIDADPLFVNDTSDFHLLPGSPATGAGPNGLDMGAYVAAGASISGEPPPVTAQTTATLSVGGPGITHYRYRLNNGAFSAETPVSQPIVLQSLANGTYRVFAIGKNSAGVWQETTNATASQSWTVNTSLAGLRINELLARNDSAVPIGGEFPDLIELYNPGATTVDLTGMSITDDESDPEKFVFPPGITIGPNQYLILYADNEDGAGIHLGFALSQSGDDVILFDASRTVVDRISFGLQIADYSIGRLSDNTWGLTRPTFGAANIPKSAGDCRRLRINEWLASPGGLLRDDFVELYNPLPEPVNFGGCYLSDAPQGSPQRHLVPALSFIPPFGFVALIADGGTDPDHLNFRLSGDQGEIALLAPDLSVIDCVIYGPQTSGIAEGRIPSGSEIFGPINPPTPGGPNPGGIGTVTNITFNLLPLASQWRYEVTGADLGTEWRATAYDDSNWPLGAALLAAEDCGCLPTPGINTSIPIFDQAGQRIVTYYFRQQFVINTNTAGFNITASTVIDDGAVIYINGEEALRIRMPTGPISYFTQALPPSVNNASLETFTLPATNLFQGTNVIAIEVHQAQLPSSDVAFGLAIDATRTVTNLPQAEVVLNEVMANNLSVTNAGQTNITDWVELLNITTHTVNLAGMSLTDDSTLPRRWVFPPGASIPAGGYLFVRFDSSMAPSRNNVGVMNTGFGLSAGGDEVYLFDTPARGGVLLDSIVFGIQAADYAIGRIPNAAGAWNLTLPTPSAANVAATLGTPLTLRINEWLASPPGNDEDYFELFNPNSQPVHLGGLYLTDNLGNRTQYRIPKLSFIGTGSEAFVRFVADNNPGAGADHVNFRLAAGGEAIGLFTATTAQIDAVTFGQQQSGVSEGRFPDGSATIVRFPGTPTPGASNLRAITDIVISEVLTHTDDPLEDAIELQNVSNGAVDISNWWLSDRRNDPKKFRIPEGTVIQPGGFAVFYEYQFNPQPGVYPGFSLSSVRGDDVYLHTANAAGELTGYRTSVRFGAAPNGVSFGRHETGVGFDFTAMSQRTFGVDTPATLANFRTGMGLSNAYPRVGPVVISEIMYHPPNLGTNENFRDEFVELHNFSTTNVALFDPAFPTNTWRLRDGVDFDFPQAVTLAPGGRLLVVSFDPVTAPATLSEFRARYGLAPSVTILGPFDGRLDNGGENVELYRPDPPQPLGSPDAGFVPYIEIDRVRYSDENPWPSAADGNTNGIGASLQRRVASNYGNDPVNWLAGVPTPGAATGSAVAAPPSITTQPASQTIAAGGSASFTVAATGAAPLTYQWRFNGANIPGATAATLNISGAQIAQAGHYSVLVANSAGSVLSAPAILVVQAPPVITQQPQSRSVAAGSPAIFTVAAQGTPPLSYQWRRNGAPIPGATAASLLIPNVQPANEGDYTVLVSNNFGSVTSLVANLSISAAPIILAHPQSTNVFVGATVTFTVQVSGSPPFSYQWRFNNVNIPGANAPTLTLTNLQTTNTGSYTVFVTNNVGAALSAPATLTVTVPPIVTVTATDPIASEPGANTGAFTISRTGPTSQGLVVEFSIGGVAVPGSDYSQITSPVIIPAGAASVPITVSPLNDALLEGDEPVVLTLLSTPQYVVGAPGSATVIIFDEDNPPPSVTLTNPVAGATFNAGVPILLAATASDPNGSVARVEFYYAATNKIGEALAAPFAFTWTNAPGGTQSLTAVAIDNLGASAVSAPVIISINQTPTVSITSPTNGANFFAVANIPITATAADLDGVVSQVEFYAGTNLIGSDATFPYSVTFNSVGVGNYSLTARAIDNQGAAGVSTPVNIVVVQPPAGFSDMFASRGILNGFTNFLAGNNSTYTREPDEPRHDNRNGNRSAWVEWIAPGSGLCTIDTFGSSFDTVLAVYQGTSLSTLTRITSNDDADDATLQSRVTFNAVAGASYAIAVDGYSAGQGGNIILRLNLPSSNPVITQHPVGQTVNQGASVTFSIVATGGQLTYQWFFNGSAILNATGSTLMLANVRATNAGNYHCVVSNATGFAVSAPAKLTVRVPPAITLQPAGQTVNPGGAATFTVAASGTEPLTYQWRFNGSPISGQTNTALALTAIQHTNAGNYSVAVANAVGAAVSQSAELIVRPVIASSRRLSNGQFELNINATPGRTYAIEVSTNNLSGWSNLTTITPSAVAGQHIDTAAPPHPRRYYRLRLNP